MKFIDRVINRSVATSETINDVVSSIKSILNTLVRVEDAMLSLAQSISMQQYIINDIYTRQVLMMAAKRSIEAMPSISADDKNFKPN